MTSEIEDKGVRVPGWALGIVATLIASSIVGLFLFVVDTREDVVRLETQVAAVERSASATGVRVDGVPAQLATLQTQMTQLQKDIVEIKAAVGDRPRHR